MEELSLVLVVVLLALAAACFAGHRGRETGPERAEDETPRPESDRTGPLQEAGGTDAEVFQRWTAMAGSLMCQLLLVFLFLWAAGGAGVRASFPLVLFLVAVGGAVLVGVRRKGAA